LAVVPFTAYLPEKLQSNQYLGIYSPVGVTLLKKKLLELNPALVHSNHLPAGKYGTKAAFLCKIPNIVTMRCMYYRKVFYYNRFVEKRICKYADKIVFNSLRGADLFRERTNAHEKVISILNGIDLNGFQLLSPIQFIRVLELLKNPKCFFYQLEFTPIKDIICS
jgi:glycosyltransferase involved in cell wall biosynthesis